VIQFTCRTAATGYVAAMDRIQWYLLALVGALVGVGILVLFNGWMPFGG
jgi:hypothetical protein